LPAPPEAQPPEPATIQTPSLPFGWHTPATHEAFAGHCASLVHVAPAHALPLQAAPPHESCTAAGQVPEPVQLAASVTTPDEHVWARHWTEAPGYAHCAGLLPSQTPPQAVPSEVHAWHWPPQAALQHTPSMHWPLKHWFAPPHAAPFASSGWQTPAEQKLPETQSVSEAQLPWHAVAPQTYGLQPCVCRAGQLPVPSQPAWSVATPALQLAPRQIVAALGYAHAVALDPSQTPPQRLPSEAHACRAP